MDIKEKLCSEFPVKPDHMGNIITLIDDGNTIPFIARYRKEMHGSCDDQLLREIADRLQYLRNLEKKKEDYIEHIESLGKMTEELRADILNAETLAVLEDLYRPYKQKRRTRATIAKERGLEPLALELLAQEKNEGTVEDMASAFVDEEKEVPDIASALQGANDIIAEIMSDSPDVRHDLKELISLKGIIRSKAKKEEDSV
ncbi:MAG: RNA-binding transcriptional accessory protein, partial [Clostridia bacterium]|nr:RNA-binding transcriptional accessory protein [Clostridia bacterium]